MLPGAARKVQAPTIAFSIAIISGVWSLDINVTSRIYRDASTRLVSDPAEAFMRWVLISLAAVNILPLSFQ